MITYSMNRLSCALLAVTLSLGCGSAFAADEFHLFRSRDPLLPRDSWGVLHTSASALNETDFSPRETWRLFYYSKSRSVLKQDPGYIGAVQAVLQRTGYYCGPIDGIFTEEVSDAIARMQKAHGLRVNGALNVSVRRTLYLP